MSAPKVTLHHLENSRSQRIIWLLEELKLNYEIKEYKRNEKDHLAPATLKAVHPLGKSPVVTVEDNGETVTLAESGAICEYLVARYGKDSTLGVKPEEGQDYCRYLQFLRLFSIG